MRIRIGMYPTPSVSKPYGLFDSRRKALAYIAELSKELSELKPRLDNYRNRRGEYRAYEYDKGVYVIDVKGIRGYVSGDEDLLTTNWWALFLGLLRDSSVGDAVDLGSTSYTLSSQATATKGAAYLSYGSGTTPESFTDYSLKARAGTISTVISIGYLSDRVRVTLSGTLPSAASELGIEQSLLDTGGNAHTTLLGRVTGSWSSGQAVTWNIDFQQPWVRAIGDYMYGVLKYINATMVRIDGTAFTANTSGDTQSGSSYLVASGSLVSWDPSLYVISNAFSITSYYADVLGTRYIRSTMIHGMYSPSGDTTVNTLGLYFPVFDTNKNTNTVCILVQPLSSPITLYASRNNLIVLRIVAF